MCRIVMFYAFMYLYHLEEKLDHQPAQTASSPVKGQIVAVMRCHV